MGNPAVQHQNFNGFPPFNSRFIDSETGIITRDWWYFLNMLWRIAGKAFNSVPDASFISGSTVFSSDTGNVVGSIITAGTAAQPQTLVTSPFIFTAAKIGLLTVFGGQVDYSRDAGVTWYPIGLTGGPIFMLVADKVRVTWFLADPPIVTFFGTA